MRLVPLLVAASALTVWADPAPKSLGKIVVMGRQDSLLGVADSATIGVTGAVQLGERPLLRPGEILETVPGLIITQHQQAVESWEVKTRLVSMIRIFFDPTMRRADPQSA